jgi:DNA-binding transcriptional MerR regulator
MEGYLRKDVAEITGIKPATIQQYTDKGLVVPSVENPGGRGTNRLYSPDDMVELLICRELVTAGVKHHDMIDVLAIVRELRGSGEEKWGIYLEKNNAERSAIYLVVADHGLESVKVNICGKHLDAFENPHIVNVDMRAKKRAVVVDLSRIFKEVIAGTK